MVSIIYMVGLLRCCMHSINIDVYTTLKKYWAYNSLPPSIHLELREKSISQYSDITSFHKIVGPSNIGHCHVQGLEFVNIFGNEWFTKMLYVFDLS